jgi:YVTN family beta-propeller protein
LVIALIAGIEALLPVAASEQETREPTSIMATGLAYHADTSAFLEPVAAEGFGWAGATVVYTETLTNQTGRDNSFALALSGNVWTTTLSITSTDVISSNAIITFTVYVSIPREIGQGASDTFTLTATFTSSPTVNSGAARFTTRVPRPGYVFNYSVDQINILDTATHTNTGQVIDIPPGLGAGSGALSPDGRWLYTSLYYGDQVGIISTTARTLVMTTPVGSRPRGLAFTPDGDYALVTNWVGNSVSVIDTSRQVVTTTIPVGEQPFDVATSSCLNKAYVANQQTGSISVINIKTLTVTKEITGFYLPVDVIVSPLGDRAYVSNSGTGDIMVIDTASDSLVATWPVTGNIMWQLASSPDGRLLYLTEGSGSTKAIDTATGKVVTVIPTAQKDAWGVEFFPWMIGPYAYVSSTNDGTVAMIDTNTNSIIRTIPVHGTPRGLALFPPPTGCFSRVYLPVVVRQ